MEKILKHTHTDNKLIQIEIEHRKALWQEEAELVITNILTKESQSPEHLNVESYQTLKKNHFYAKCQSNSTRIIYE